MILDSQRVYGRVYVTPQAKKGLGLSVLNIPKILKSELGIIEIIHLGRAHSPLLCHPEANICDFGFSGGFREGSCYPQAETGSKSSSYDLKTLKNELSILEILYLGSSSSSLCHLEDKICDLGISKGFRGAFGAPQAKIGYKVTS